MAAHVAAMVIGTQANPEDSSRPREMGFSTSPCRYGSRVPAVEVAGQLAIAFKEQHGPALERGYGVRVGREP
jgi:hypothetical protein